MSAREAAEGFVRIAVDNMANAIKQISIARGHDVTRYTLQCFGGAGGQHACLVADALGIEHGDDPPARRRAQRLRHGAGRHGRAAAADAGRGGAGGGAGGAGGRGGGGAGGAGRGEPGDPAARGACATRAAIRASKSRCRTDMREDFEAAHKLRFGFDAPETAVVVETAIVEAVVLPGIRGGGPAEGWWRGRSREALRALRSPSPSPGRICIDRADLSPRRHRLRPRPDHRSLRHHRRRARLAGARSTRSATSSSPAPIPAPPPPPGAEVDPVMLEVMANLFMAIAEEMGVALQNTASSVNIKERLDFSCALFDRDGSLIANAPHIPVHLGSMGDSIRTMIEARGEGRDGRGMKRGRRLCAQRALSRRHPSARHHRDHAGLRRTATRSPPGMSRRAATMPISAASRRDRCRRTAGRSTRRAC